MWKIRIDQEFRGMFDVPDVPDVPFSSERLEGRRWSTTGSFKTAAPSGSQQLRFGVGWMEE